MSFEGVSIGGSYSWILLWRRTEPPAFLQARARVVTSCLDWGLWKKTPRMQDFNNLIVWRRAHDLALEIYRESQQFPLYERFGLTAQIRRAGTSVPSNIAEGCGRASRADFARFIQISIGSASELEYQLLLARDLSYIPHERWSALSEEAVEVRRMLISLYSRLTGR